MSRFSSGYVAFDLVGKPSTAGGGLGAFSNPEGSDLIIVDVKLYIATPSAGTANVSVGTAANQTTASTNLINALTVNGSVGGKAYHGMAALAANDEVPVWGPNRFITVTGSADSTGFVGRLFVKYIRATGE